ncbi:MAG: ABC transporter substrate-binding protein [Candidatus Bathyarchaeia archaeon]
MASTLEKVIVILVAITILMSGITLYYVQTLQQLIPNSPTVALVGFDYGLTGAGADQGQAARKTFDMAISDFNNAGGLTIDGKSVKVQAVWADNQWDPNTAASTAEYLITEQHVITVFGGIYSSLALPMAQVCQQYKIPMMGGDASSPTLTDGRFQYYFRVVANDNMFGSALFQFLKNESATYNIPIHTIAYLYEDSSFGSGCEAGWAATNNSTDYNYTVVANIPYNMNTADVTSEVLTLKSANPDVVFQAGYVNDGLLYAKAFKQLNWYPKAILTQDGENKPAFIAAIAGTNLADYWFNVLSWSPDVNKPLSNQVRDEFNSLYGNGSAYTDVIGWDTAFRTWCSAVNKANSLDPQKIRDALSSTVIPSDQIPSVGSVKFDAGGQNINIGLVITQFFNGTTSGTWATVYPPDVKATNVVFPMPQSQSG